MSSTSQYQPSDVEEKNDLVVSLHTKPRPASPRLGATTYLLVQYESAETGRVIAEKSPSTVAACSPAGESFCPLVSTALTCNNTSP
jgi:hypothetical protein